jgi:two-component system, OmpR family, sensor histidine kinase ResE
VKRLVTWLMGAFVGVVLLATLARTLLLTYSLDSSGQQDAIASAMEDARDMADWAQHRWDRAPVDIRFSLSTMARVANARVWLVDTNGRVRVDTQGNPSWEGVAIQSAELARALKGQESLVAGKSPWLDAAVAYVVPVVRNQEVLGAVYLFLPVEGGMRPHSHSAEIIWSAVFSLLISALIAAVVARKLAAPVEAITRFARSLGKGDFTSTIHVRSIEEVNVLADTLTQVSGQLKTSFDTISTERQRLTAILASMQEGVVVMDAGGRLTLVNPAAVSLLGWRDPDGCPAAITDPAIPDRLRQALTQAISGGTHEVSFRLRDTQEVLAVCSPVPVGEGGEVGALAVLRDMSSVLRLQRLRENFIADVAHELRGPLANLSVLAEAFGDGTIAWEERAPYVRQLQDEVARLGRLSYDVLDLAQLDAGVMPAELEAVELAPYVTSLVSRQGGPFRAAGVHLHCDIPAGLKVLISPLRMDQVLTNLLENALRHTPAGGSVRVVALPVNGQVCLAVSDTGTGIPPEHLPNIFERFYKADPARTRGKAGTGLGLSIVRQLTELQGGHITVSSEMGKGAEFRVYMLVAA